MINIRLLEKKDKENYLELMSKFRKITKKISDNDFNNLYDNIFFNSEIFIAEFNNKIIGSITIFYEQKFIHNYCKYGHIEDVFVEEKFRKKKIGSLLIKKVLETAKNNNCYKCILSCSEKNKIFYLKNNFGERGINMSCLL